MTVKKKKRRNLWRVLGALIFLFVTVPVAALVILSIDEERPELDDLLGYRRDVSDSENGAVILSLAKGDVVCPGWFDDDGPEDGHVGEVREPGNNGDPIRTADFNQVTQTVIGAAIEVHKALGPGRPSSRSAARPPEAHPARPVGLGPHEGLLDSLPAPTVLAPETTPSVTRSRF